MPGLPPLFPGKISDNCKKWRGGGENMSGFAVKIREDKKYKWNKKIHPDFKKWHRQVKFIDGLIAV